MLTESSQHFARDRRDDPLPDGHLYGKPPVLRRTTLQGLCLICLIVIVYGTVGPLGLAGQRWLVPAESWQWAPPWQHSDFNDLFTNFAVYIPVGLAFRLLLRRRGRAGFSDFSTALLLSVGLSYATELAQQIMPARSANFMDCVVNSAGAFAGCLLGPFVQRWLRQTHARAYQARRRESWDLPAWFAALVTTGLMLVPLRPAALSVEVDFARKLDIEDIRRFGMFVVLGYCLAAATIQRHGNTLKALRAALAPAFLMAITLELAQAFIATHACGLLDMLVAALGGVAGCGAATKSADIGLIHDGSERPQCSSGRSHRTLQIIALIATVVCAIVFGLRHLLSPDNVGLEAPVVFWMPFQIHFAEPFHRAITSVFETLSLYAFLTMLCLLLARGGGRAVSLLLVMGLSTLIEAWRLLADHGAADITMPLLALVAWYGTVRMWTALTPQTLPPIATGFISAEPPPALQPR